MSRIKRITSVVCMQYPCKNSSTSHSLRFPITGYALQHLGFDYIVHREPHTITTKIYGATLWFGGEPKDEIQWRIRLAPTGEHVCYVPRMDLRWLFRRCEEDLRRYVTAVDSSKVIHTIALNAPHPIRYPADGKPVDATYRPPRKSVLVRVLNGCCL